MLKVVQTRLLEDDSYVFVVCMVCEAYKRFEQKECGSENVSRGINFFISACVFLVVQNMIILIVFVFDSDV